jgi:hypothetical protein
MNEAGGLKTVNFGMYFLLCVYGYNSKPTGNYNKKVISIHKKALGREGFLIDIEFTSRRP